MKWLDRSPKEGDTRLKRRFALFPTNIGNNVIIWLEFYYVQQRYIIEYSSMDGFDRYWKTIRIYGNR
jgi:hypothetical protein